MFIILEITANLTYTKSLQISLLVITVGGFLLATIVGSIAWYISKRPVGWENAQTPGWISKLTKNINTQKKSSDK